MRITLRVYATLCRHVPGAVAGGPLDVDLNDGATLADLFGKMAIPEREVKTAFVNGKIRKPDWLLEEGDRVGIFPPVGGG